VPDLFPSVRAKEFSGFLVPDDSAHLHTVLAVAIRADNFIGIGFIRITLCPASDNLAGRNIMRIMAALTERIYLGGRIYGFRKGRVVLVVPVREGLPVAAETNSRNHKPRSAASAVFHIGVIVQNPAGIFRLGALGKPNPGTDSSTCDHTVPNELTT